MPKIISGMSSAFVTRPSKTWIGFQFGKREVRDHTKFQVAPDGKTLTLTVHETGQPHGHELFYDRMWIAQLRKLSDLLL